MDDGGAAAAKHAGLPIIEDAERNLAELALLPTRLLTCGIKVADVKRTSRAVYPACSPSTLRQPTGRNCCLL